jgi:DNA polymerase-3 subunit delta'
MNIRQEQHHATLWIQPKNNTYTRQDLESIFHTLSFTLQPDEQFFFILQAADFFSINSANSLLKSLEEPPRGYHFILLAQRLEMILPTIISRCITTQLHTQDDALHTHPLLLALTSSTRPRSSELFKLIESPITEQETIRIIDALIRYWTIQWQQAEPNTTAYTTSTYKVHVLIKHLSQLPMPGSSKLFWKNVIIHFF